MLTVVIDNLPSDCAPVLRTLVRPTGLFQQIVLRISPRLEVLLIGDLLHLLLLLLRLGKDLLLMQLLTNKLFDLCGVRDYLAIALRVGSLKMPNTAGSSASGTPCSSGKGCRAIASPTELSAV